MSLEFEMPLVSLIFLILLMVVYFLKPRVHLRENRLYEGILIVSTIEALINTIIHFICSYHTLEQINADFYNIFNNLNRVLSFAFVFIFACLFFYTALITYEKENKTLKKLFISLSAFLGAYAVFLLSTNIEIFRIGTVTGVTGSTITTSYIMVALFLLMSIVIILKNLNKFDKRYIPIVLVLVILGILYVFSITFPGMIIYDIALTLLCYIMFFTIENPDLKMLKTVELAKTQAEQANAAKTDFLSSMSHEIRTPLNAIVGFSECIVKADSLEAAKNDAKDIIMASQNLLEIVNGILDISKIESGKMELVNTEYDIVKMGENLTKLMKARMGEKPIEFQCKFADDLPGILYGDEGKVKQIVTNILTNAIKYTEKGFINFEVSCINEGTSCKLVISIEDTGRGIKPEKMNSLFNKFERLEEDKNTTLEGTGLGLAITKRLVEMMKGKIIVQSKYGEGTKFTVYIVQQIRAMERKTVEESYSSNRIADFSGKKIMVVDDNKLNIKIASRLLSEYKVIIEECESGFECIDKINEGNTYDLILMDDMMPKLSGVETFKRLQLIEGFHIPVVALTANAIEGMREQYLEEGFNDYLSKPINKDELNRVLNAYLAMKIVNVDIFEPLPSSIYEITDDDIREIDELMPKVELEQSTTDEIVDNINEEAKEDASNNVEVESQQEEPKVEFEKQKETSEEISEEKNVESDESTNIEVEDRNIEVSEEIDIQETEKEAPVVIAESSINNKGSKEFLISNDIDVDAGLELLGDMEMYDETLQGFLKETIERLPMMEEYKDSNDMKNYAILAHAMKSDSKYLGFKKLAELSLNHELKGKEDDSNYVNDNYEELITEANRIVNIVKEYLGE